ncbi:hypothetical protein AYO38_07615 [bacterium SCGC AG-212-C10]|nr:hypothetical protein AYO38_07615 [bacterium SCGC AG-212-C10]
MTPLEIVRTYYSLFDSPSREKLDSVVTDDFALDDNPIDWHLRGKEDLWRTVDRPHSAPPADQPPAFVVVDYVGDAERGAAKWHWRVTGGGAVMLGLPRTDKVAEVDGVAMVTFSDGKLTSLTEYWDAASAMRQLGADIHQPRFGAPVAAG